MARDTNHFDANTLLTRGASARKHSVPRRKRFVRVVLVNHEQTALAAAPDEDHRAARAFTLPAVAFERSESVGKAAAQIAAGR